ncbi:hypothetical protein TNIN_225241 [Trichonephila inaurata madagascariensis]|uniref:Uncharacterized protein n=1 Tax=Trichonephila inaurata madagascariensis TaxID=2747483 RepID=A0A8X7CKT3_9ARAC|nr:hypothetical protein TNIN_225241 [Trichonephila inaurata madagascariensis]
MHDHVGSFLNGLPRANFLQGIPHLYAILVAQDFIVILKPFKDRSPKWYLWNQIIQQMSFCQSVQDLEVYASEFGILQSDRQYPMPNHLNCLPCCSLWLMVITSKGFFFDNPRERKEKKRNFSSSLETESPLDISGNTCLILI